MPALPIQWLWHEGSRGLAAPTRLALSAGSQILLVPFVVGMHVHVHSVLLLKCGPATCRCL